jgi:hypothetical protein
MLPLAIALLAVAGGVTPGPSITLNGVGIDGVTDQRFENCTVVIDGQGNVHIEAKGYAVKATEVPAAIPPRPPAAATAPAAAAPAAGAAPAPRAAQAARVTRRYFLASEPSRPDGAGYDVAIFINAAWIREIKSTEPQVVFEITRHLRPGLNKVVFAATKRPGPERRATGRDATLKLVIGEGNVGGDHVMIDLPLVEMTRNGAESDDRTEEFVLEAR